MIIPSEWMDIAGQVTAMSQQWKESKHLIQRRVKNKMIKASFWGLDDTRPH